MATPVYDFVVVGGGTAGLAIATRLSEDPSQRVLVLEAGSNLTQDPRIVTPPLYEPLLVSEAAWPFQTEPQYAFLNGRSVNVSQGKTLGGSSSINAHAFVPPDRDTIDAWGSLGNDGWGWDLFKKYLDKVYTFPSVDSDTKTALGIDGWVEVGKSARGPIAASFPGDPSHPIRKAWAETFKDLGHLYTRDPFLHPNGSCSCLSSINPNTKERGSSATTYYLPMRGRTNLEVVRNAVVEKFIFDKSKTGKYSIRATGVQ